MKQALFLILLLNIIIYLSCQGAKLGKTIEKKLEEDEDLNKYEEDHSMEQKMKELLDEYVKEQKWKPEQQLNKETFKKMFVYLIQRGALRQGSSTILKKLADKILEKHGEPIIVKNLDNYFNIMELTLTYTRLLNPSNKNTDL